MPLSARVVRHYFEPWQVDICFSRNDISVIDSTSSDLHALVFVSRESAINTVVFREHYAEAMCSAVVHPHLRCLVSKQVCFRITDNVLVGEYI